MSADERGAATGPAQSSRRPGRTHPSRTPGAQRTLLRLGQGDSDGGGGGGFYSESMRAALQPDSLSMFSSTDSGSRPPPAAARPGCGRRYPPGTAQKWLCALRKSSARRPGQGSRSPGQAAPRRPVAPSRSLRSPRCGGCGGDGRCRSVLDDRI